MEEFDCEKCVERLKIRGGGLAIEATTSRRESSILNSHKMKMDSTIAPLNPANKKPSKAIRQ